jgi:hypothetical protein
LRSIRRAYPAPSSAGGSFIRYVAVPLRTYASGFASSRLAIAARTSVERRIIQRVRSARAKLGIFARTFTWRLYFSKASVSSRSLPSEKRRVREIDDRQLDPLVGERVADAGLLFGSGTVPAT